ncbi:sigma-E factor regulatory protein RseB [Salinivibrio kushneri]|uniref:sigma-E factor regulatory protein RseB n=1 Tax=Salinivibrio kushneri TaxID=1908198 RepID=UPI00098880E4|nr:sigma-E factor regulatory protein RseB [Salinivibrio kushneri]OOE35291.1 sigma-E factor regulatory protein RseB [Salinivibrio kushneri]OOE36334.1 sigma-E factor regulatory protein RseB [Salinivibrio kushneri]OOE55977.1 sigma-E factor regulatory protein RseB [Salinivibrio kushneri]OOE70606.1 sigma-E factor regulatory protein RseB [Salinivibrio kushneri]
MKKTLIGALALVSLMSAQASAEPSAEALLHQMDTASDTLDYEVSYILVGKNSLEPLRFRHAQVGDDAYGHLMYLSGPPREVIRRGGEISYFEPGYDPFTIASDHMVAPLPTLIQADIDVLANHYDFVSMGHAREAGMDCQVVRITPKDGERYSYVLWLDEKSKLPVRADLLDRDGDPLEQYRALSLVVSSQISTSMQKLAELALPPVLTLPQTTQRSDLDWQVTALPEGFEPVYSNRHRLMMTKRAVESQMFSDGLFSFSVYLAKADDVSVRKQIVRQGRRTLHSVTSGNAEITVVGDIPPETAKRVAESVRIIDMPASQSEQEVEP